MSGKERYVIERLKKGYILLYSPHRLRLFNGKEFLPLDTAVIRSLKKQNIVHLDRTEGGEDVYLLNEPSLWKLEAKSLPGEKTKRRSDFDESPDTSFEVESSFEE